jgi:hypothetical protein
MEVKFVQKRNKGKKKKGVNQQMGGAITPFCCIKI